MRKYILLVTFTICTVGLFAQSPTATTDVQIGTIFEIGKPEANTYKHINFPKSNIIIKRGGIVNYKHIVGSVVIVTSSKEKKDGTTVIKIKRKDGRRFFGSHTVISADLKDALRSGELRAK